MKKSIFIFVTAIAAFGITYGQSIELIHNGEIKNDNDTIVVHMLASTSSKQYTDIVNLTENIINLKIRREIISIVTGAESEFCFDNCVSNTLPVYDMGPVGISGGDTLSQGKPNHFYTTYYPNGNKGTSVFKFSFINNDSLSESKSLFFIFIASETDMYENAYPSLSIRTYPNPAGNSLNILSENADIQRVDLYNMQGQLIKEEQLINNTIDISYLPAGIYSLRIITEKGVAVKNIIKQ